MVAREKERVKSDASAYLRATYRHFYKLPVTDPRYLATTDREVVRDFGLRVAIREMEREQSHDEYSAALPLCTQCGYCGVPADPKTCACPRCGEIMQVGDVYVDDELEAAIDKEMKTVRRKSHFESGQRT